MAQDETPEPSSGSGSGSSPSARLNAAAPEFTPRSATAAAHHHHHGNNHPNRRGLQHHHHHHHHGQHHHHPHQHYQPRHKPAGDDEGDAAAAAEEKGEGAAGHAPRGLPDDVARRVVKQGITKHDELHMDLKAEEFRALKQGAMTVNQYIKKFMKLARYAPEDVNTDKKKQDRFKKGLRGEMRTFMTASIYPDFNTLMNKSILLEDALASEHNERKRKFQERQERSQRLRIGYPPKPQYRPTMQYRASSSNPPPPSRQNPSQNSGPTRKSNTTLNQAATVNTGRACFGCGDPGHMIASCPYKNQGSKAPVHIGAKPAGSVARNAPQGSGQ